MAAGRHVRGMGRSAAGGRLHRARSVAVSRRRARSLRTTHGVSRRCRRPVVRGRRVAATVRCVGRRAASARARGTWAGKARRPAGRDRRGVAGIREREVGRSRDASGRLPLVALHTVEERAVVVAGEQAHAAAALDAEAVVDAHQEPHVALALRAPLGLSVVLVVGHRRAVVPLQHAGPEQLACQVRCTEQSSGECRRKAASWSLGRGRTPARRRDRATVLGMARQRADGSARVIDGSAAASRGCDRRVLRTPRPRAVRIASCA